MNANATFGAYAGGMIRHNPCTPEPSTSPMPTEAYSGSIVRGTVSMIHTTPPIGPEGMPTIGVGIIRTPDESSVWGGESSKDATIRVRFIRRTGEIIGTIDRTPRSPKKGDARKVIGYGVWGEPIYAERTPKGAKMPPIRGFGVTLTIGEKTVYRPIRRISRDTCQSVTSTIRPTFASAILVGVEKTLERSGIVDRTLADDATSYVTGAFLALLDSGQVSSATPMPMVWGIVRRSCRRFLRNERNQVKGGRLYAEIRPVYVESEPMEGKPSLLNHGEEAFRLFDGRYIVRTHVEDKKTRAGSFRPHTRPNDSGVDLAESANNRGKDQEDGAYLADRLMNRLDSTERTVLGLFLRGADQSTIAENIGCGQPNVSKIMRRVLAKGRMMVGVAV